MIVTAVNHSTDNSVFENTINNNETSFLLNDIENSAVNSFQKEKMSDEISEIYKTYYHFGYFKINPFLFNDNQMESLRNFFKEKFLSDVNKLSPSFKKSHLFKCPDELAVSLQIKSMQDKEEANEEKQFSILNNKDYRKDYNDVLNHKKKLEKQKEKMHRELREINDKYELKKHKLCEKIQKADDHKDMKLLLQKIEEEWSIKLKDTQVNWNKKLKKTNISLMKAEYKIEEKEAESIISCHKNLLENIEAAIRLYEQKKNLSPVRIKLKSD